MCIEYFKEDGIEKTIEYLEQEDFYTDFIVLKNLNEDVCPYCEILLSVDQDLPIEFQKDLIMIVYEKIKEFKNGK